MVGSSIQSKVAQHGRSGPPRCHERVVHLARRHERPFHDIPAAPGRPHGPGVTLVGDAAHLMPPHSMVAPPAQPEVSTR
ncbi:hypothetical protein EIY87_06580 [Amycolatopsis eburnea]|uniref:Uncharacterized protein n=1 Tax=Amycolatopsis eburnea TaxID=2267691 RepID=A0A3R9EV36_9PSEU|nr:hypothetical protein EIY87_06580 [Amycolatopsis eburnea]